MMLLFLPGIFQEFDASVNGKDSFSTAAGKQDSNTSNSKAGGKHLQRAYSTISMKDGHFVSKISHSQQVTDGKFFMGCNFF